MLLLLLLLLLHEVAAEGPAVRPPLQIHRKTNFIFLTRVPARLL